jgi:hypothetical protein
MARLDRLGPAKEVTLANADAAPALGMPHFLLNKRRQASL